MKKTRIITFIIAVLFFGVAFAQSHSANEYISNSLYERLQKQGTVGLIHPVEENKITLVPDCKYADQIKTNLVAKTDGGVPFIAEYLYLIPKSQLLQGSSKVGITNDDVSVVLRSISKMQGMRYHFNEKKDGDILYKYAYTIDGKNSKKQIADQTEGSADGKVIYAYQKDHTYGDTNYILKYSQNEDITHVCFENTKAMQYLGFKAVAEGKIRINVLSIDCGDALLLYLATDVDAKKVPLFNMRNQIADSMTERMDAIYRWFMVQFK